MRVPAIKEVCIVLWQNLVLYRTKAEKIILRPLPPPMTKEEPNQLSRISRTHYQHSEIKAQARSKSFWALYAIGLRSVVRICRKASS